MTSSNLRVSYSSLNTFSSCARKFEFDKLYPKRPRDSDMYAADVGSALHAGYQHWLTHHDHDEAVWAFMQAFPFEGEFRQPNDYRNFSAALSTLEEMFLEAKIGEYELAQIKNPQGETVPAIEVPFEIEFLGFELPDGRGISFTGYIDAIMQSQVSGLFRTLDIKTSRMSLRDATAKFKFDTQQIPYGIVVDHVAQGSVDEFEVLYLDAYIDLLEPRVKLYPFKKTRRDVQEWCVNKLVQFNQIRDFMSNEFFPRTDGGCLFYQSPCRYIEPCISRDRDSLVEWFLLGREPAPEEPFDPWIKATIDVRS